MCARKTPIAPVRSQRPGATNRSERLAPSRRTAGHDLIDIASPTTRTQKSRLPPARAGKMVMCEKPLGRNGDEAKRGRSRRVGRYPEHVWLQLRRVPAWTMIKSLLTRDASAASFTTARNFCRIGRCRGNCRKAARGCGMTPRSPQRRHGRPAGPLHRYGDVAQRSDCGSERDDRDLHQGTEAQRERARRARRHRRREAHSCADSKTDRSRRSKRHDMRAGTKPWTTLEIMASTGLRSGPSRLHRVQVSIIAMRDCSRVERTCTSPTRHRT